MSGEQLTGREAVERLAEQHASHARWGNWQNVSASQRPGGTAYRLFHENTNATLRALLSERDAATARAEGAERERDALRDEWEEIAAGITTEQPEVGALWPMVSEVSGNLSAVRNLFKNEIAAHNRTKEQRDAATAERDRLAEALDRFLNDAEPCRDFGEWFEACCKKASAALDSINKEPTDGE